MLKAKAKKGVLAQGRVRGVTLMANEEILESLGIDKGEDAHERRRRSRCADRQSRHSDERVGVKSEDIVRRNRRQSAPSKLLVIRQVVTALSYGQGLRSLFRLRYGESSKIRRFRLGPR